MGIKENQYSIFTMLRKRVLDKAIDEINEKTDIFVSYDLERAGRKVISILLHMKAKNKNQLTYHAPHAIEEKLKGFWINSKTIQTLLEERDEEYLLANIAIMEEKLKEGKISNPAGYLMKAFEDDYRPKETQYSKQQQVEELAKKAQEAQEQQIKEEEKLKQDHFTSWKQSLVTERLEQLGTSEKENYKNEFIESMVANPLFSKMLDSKWFDDKLIQKKRYKFLEPKLLLEHELDFEGYIPN